MTDSSQDGTTNYTASELRLYDIQQTVELVCWSYVFAVMFILGIIGNVLTIVVLLRGSFKQSSAVVYLFALALLDIAALISAFLSDYLMTAWTVILMDINPGWCKFLKALFPFFSNAGFWVLVAFTVDRYIAVCFPLRKAFLCRPRRAIAVCAILLLVSAAKQLQTFWAIGWRYGYDTTTSSYYHWCGILERYLYFERYIRPYLSAPFVLVIPLVVIMTCNILIIRSQRRRNRLLQQVNADRQTTQITAMCLTISSAFFICATPVFGNMVAYPYTHRSGIDMEGQMKTRIADDLAALFVYLHHSINFYLYCLAGRQFRADLKKTLCGLCPRCRFQCRRELRGVNEAPNAAATGSSSDVGHRMPASPQVSCDTTISTIKVG